MPAEIPKEMQPMQELFYASHCIDIVLSRKAYFSNAKRLLIDYLKQTLALIDAFSIELDAEMK